MPHPAEPGHGDPAPDHIDLYQYHRPDTETDIEETLSALSDLVHSGKVRTIGTSKLPAAEIVEAHWVAERRGFDRFRSEQPTYSILNRGIERDVLPVTERYGTGTIVWSPLAQGMLTGRVRRGRQSKLTRSGAYYAHLSDELLDRIDAIVPPGTDVGQLQMAYNPPAVVTPTLRRRPVDERTAA